MMRIFIASLIGGLFALSSAYGIGDAPDVATAKLADVFADPLPAKTADVSTLEWVYVDYTDSDLIKEAVWRSWGTVFSMLHSKVAGNRQPLTNLVSSKISPISGEYETISLEQYIKANIANRLAGEGFVFGQGDKYFGIMPVQIEVSVKLGPLVEGYPVEIKSKFLVIAGHRDQRPAFNKSFPCSGRGSGTAFDTAVGNQFKECFRRIIEKALKDDDLKAFLEA
jgi:hypothetical protein